MAGEVERIWAVGLSHHTAPVDVRERLALDEPAVVQELRHLTAEGVCEEALVLATCNRVEYYAVPRDLERFRLHLRAFRTPDGQSVDKYLYWHRGSEAVRHLFRVASSLDSLVVGEPQILGQVKSAVRLAQEAESLGRLLHPLTQRTLSVAKRVRSETEVGKSRVGIGNAGVDLALQIFGGLAGQRAMLVGVGEMGRQVARALLSAGLSELLVTNRTFERAVELAQEHGGTAVPWERLEEYLPRADVVLVATGASRPVLGVAAVRAALRVRRFRPMFLVDLSVPRNIAPAVADLEEAFLFNIDDLQQVVEKGKAHREQAAAGALAVVDQEAEKFVASLSRVEAGPMLGAIARRAEALRSAELERSGRLLGSLNDEQREALDAMTRALVKKLTHGTLQSVREAAERGDRAALEHLMEAWK